MNDVFNELKIKTENLLYISSEYYTTCKLRKCIRCLRWIRFCTSEYTVCGTCTDDIESEMMDIEDHKDYMKDVMTELKSKFNKD